MMKHFFLYVVWWIVKKLLEYSLVKRKLKKGKKKFSTKYLKVNFQNFVSMVFQKLLIFFFPFVYNFNTRAKKKRKKKKNGHTLHHKKKKIWKAMDCKMLTWICVFDKCKIMAILIPTFLPKNKPELFISIQFSALTFSKHFTLKLWHLYI